MTGLDKITAQITVDSDKTVESIIASSEAQCSDILAKAEAEAQQILKSGETNAQRKADEIIRRAESSAELEQRKILLTTKQEVISSMVAASLETLRSLPEDKYFDIIYKMISKYMRSSQGQIFFNNSDLARLPKDFIGKLSELSQGNLTLCSDFVKIDGGFILSYGGIDVNCSFESLFSDNSEKISDAVAKLLFG